MQYIFHYPGYGTVTAPYKYPEWEHEYTLALVETDNAALPKRIAEAEKAIFMRNSNAALRRDNEAERLAIQDAIKNLRVLKMERLDTVRQAGAQQRPAQREEP